MPWGERVAYVGDPDGNPVALAAQAAQHLTERSGDLGTVCIYEASSPEAIRKHPSRADLPVTEIIPIADTVIVRPDPVAAP